MIKNLIYQFMCLIENEQVEVYNEFSFQHELGIFLRNNLLDYKVQFERNVKFFNISGTMKHEIDIVIYNGTERYAIELKYPLNGQYPEQMYSFIKDIIFMEELKDYGFTDTYCLTLVKDKNFYSGKKNDGIYSFFRADNLLTGTINKPTGKIIDSVTLRGKYRINWEGNTNQFKFYIVDICEGI